MLQAALEAEMADHRGYELGETTPAGPGNHGNGSSPKTERTEIGDVRLDVPRPAGVVRAEVGSYSGDHLLQAALVCARPRSARAS